MERTVYAPHSANAPRLKTDAFFSDDANTYRYRGFVDRATRFVEEFQLLRPELWRRFVQQFREEADNDAGWRGEYWGKMMRGACFTWAYTRDEKLYALLTQTVQDMMDSQDELGRISTYGVPYEFDGWDMWSRKYMLLGMQYYLEICTDEAFAQRIVVCMCRQLDYIIAHIGEGEGKKPITSATRNWRGMNSCSILEPVVRLYNLTQRQEYLDFAAYIVRLGGTDVNNLFELAYEDDFYPYQYPVTKAYEMTSCFEGLLEYYRATGETRWRDAVVHFADKVLESDFTIIGSSGCTHELFDHSTVRQANTTNGSIQQETCVTVTLMKFFWQLTLLTGDSKYVDAFEISLYNAYYGAINTEKVVDPSITARHPDWRMAPLPFDSYSPLTAGMRGKEIGGLMLMSDKHYYGCCACIGSVGNGLVPKMQWMTSREGFVMNLYIDGTLTGTTNAGQAITVETQTAYPVEGEVRMTVHLPAPEAFEWKLRIPAWSSRTALTLNGQPVEVTAGYTALQRTWQEGDELVLTLDMRTRALRPTPYGHDILMNKTVWSRNYMVATYDREDPLAKRHIALLRGPLVLAQENRLGYSVDTPISVAVDADGTVAVQRPAQDTAPYPHLLELSVPLTDGGRMTVTDYASAGKLWNEKSKMAVWMLTE